MAPAPPGSDDAVSPVVGTILMVAITVVVAATLFLIVRTLGDSNDEGPYVQFLRDNQDGQLKVVRFTRDIDLADVQVKVDREAYFAFNGEADRSGVRLEADTYVRLATARGTLLAAGDRLDFCVAGASDSTAVTVRVASPDAAAMIYENSFTGLDECPP